MKKLKVNVHQGYEIIISKNILCDCGAMISSVTNAKNICLVSDSNVFPIYGDTVKNSIEKQGYNVFEFVYDAGEKSKTPATVLNIVEHMAENHFTRDDIVVALGGGVCGDMAGFAASIFLRGIDFVQIPTSLLAQVDSSVGGKTGVDLPQGKNLCGAFHQPILVIIDTNVLSTLSPHFFADGMGEVIKYGCIKSPSLFKRLEQENPMDFIEDLIYECVDIKRQVVENDEKEHGERALLNFGHTAGHAIEKLWNFDTISHGEAVGIGMVMVAKAGERNGITEIGTSEKIENLLKKYSLKLCDSHSTADIVSAMNSDKKRTESGIKLILLKNIGTAYVKLTSFEDVKNFFGE